MRPYPSVFPIDNSAILYLAQMGPDHTNVYRFTVIMETQVDPDLLQQAAARVYSRFPTIYAGFRPGRFSYQMVPVREAPQVRQDPGLLHVMSREEIQDCAYRIYYRDRQIIIEAFHGLTDGYGAVASLKALLAEYIYLCNGICAPERTAFLEEAPDWEEELKDVYPDHSGERMGSLPRQYAYQLKRSDASPQVHTTLHQVPTQSLRSAAKRNGISVTSMLSALMAEAIMEIQNRRSQSSRKLPVRIMVPVDLRNPFPSRTLRNFILYALPTLAPEESNLSRKERFHHFQAQLRKQTNAALLKAQITRNVKIQSSFLFRSLPLAWKCALMRLSYCFFGESNSSITLTNLGPVALSDALGSQVADIQVHLMPRRGSPYNCGLLSCGEVTNITITRFGAKEELEELFFCKLQEVLH